MTNLFPYSLTYSSHTTGLALSHLQYEWSRSDRSIRLLDIELHCFIYLIGYWKCNFPIMIPRPSVGCFVGWQLSFFFLSIIKETIMVENSVYYSIILSSIFLPTFLSFVLSFFLSFFFCFPLVPPSFYSYFTSFFFSPLFRSSLLPSFLLPSIVFSFTPSFPHPAVLLCFSPAFLFFYFPSFFKPSPSSCRPFWSASCFPSSFLFSALYPSFLASFLTFFFPSC